MKYLRLLRLPDQYILLEVGIVAGLYFNVRSGWLFTWVVAVFCISIATFIVNELIDRNDTDIYSWNHIHIRKNDRLHPFVVFFLLSFFSATGLVLAYKNGIVGWGLIMLAVGFMYSVPPIRLKARFALDIVAQLFCWVLVPFLAVGSVYGNNDTVVLFVMGMMCFVWAITFPYQLSDFTADKKAHIHGTHTTLGMKNSLLFGILISIVGTILFIYLRLYLLFPWSIFFLFVNIFVLFRYVGWIRMKSVEKQVISLQQYVRFVKPLGYIGVPYLLFWMFLLIK